MNESVHEPPACLKTLDELTADIDALEAKMESLQLRHRDVFSFATVWAEHYDAIVAATPPHLRIGVEQRLLRIGIRWGVAHGPRMTGQFPAFKG